MGISLHVTGYGRPAAERLATCIRDIKKDDPLVRVTVVVPTNSVGVAIRRALGRGELRATDDGKGVVGMTFLTIYRLAELLGAPILAAQGRRPASTPVIAAALREELRDDAGVFTPVADHPATQESLIHAHRELSDCSESALDTLSKASARARDVVDLHRRVRRRLADRWYQEVDLVTEATVAISAGAPVLDDLGSVLLYLPQDLSATDANLITTLAEHRDVVVVAAATGAAGADQDTHRTLRRLGIDTDIPVDLTPPIADGAIAVSDPEDETREAATLVIEAARNGTPLERLAILYPQAQPYARLVDDMLTAANIPANGLAVRSLAERTAGRWLLDVLALPERDYRRASVMSVLTEAPVTGLDGQRVAVTAWERVSRSAGVVAGVNEWHDRLTAWADAQRAQANLERESTEGRDWLAERLDRAAADADEFRNFVTGFIARVEQGQALATWSDLATWARRLLTDHLGDEQVRQRWPDDERSAADRVEAALDRLEGLDAVEPSTTLETFRRTLRLELDADLGRRGTLGVGVLTGPPSMALGVDLDLVIVLGMAEGIFPPRVREDSLLADRERVLIEDELAPRAHRTDALHRQYLAAIASAERSVLLWPRGDMRRSTERHPSRWLLDTCEAHTGSRSVEVEVAKEPFVVQVPSFAARVQAVTFPVTEQDHTLRQLATSSSAIDAVAGANPRFGRSRDLARARAGSDFSRFDGNLSDVADALPPILAPDGRPLSASSLEGYVECPHAWFAQRLLGVEPLEDPETRFQISALDRGRLVHQVLERWLQEQIDAGPPAPDQPWNGTARARLLAIADELFDHYHDLGLTGHPSLWALHRRQMRADFERFLIADDRLRCQGRQTPEQVEFSFGPVELPVGSQGAISLRGTIDRLDRTDDGGVVVIDYKTGSSRYTTGLSPDNPDLGGRQLQLLLYAQALRTLWAQPDLPVSGTYWYVTSKGKFVTAGYDVAADLAERLSHTIDVIIDGMRNGRFPLVPEAMNRWTAFVPCPYCEPDSLGTADVYRRWERLRSHPDLRTFIRLMDPDVAAELDQAERDADG